MAILLNKGILYVPPKNYESPESQAKRAWIEYRKKQKDEQETLNKTIASELFPEWIARLGHDEKGSILTETFGEKWDIVPEPKQNQCLNDYYNQYILPKELNKIQEGRI